MKASIEWLSEYADIEVDTVTLAQKLTMTGSKVETIQQIGKDIKNVVVGKILEIKKHPDADKLVVTKVDIGDEKIQIVTGAKNIKEEDLVPIAKNGASLPNGITIKTGKLRGIESQRNDVFHWRIKFNISRLSRTNRRWNYDIKSKTRKRNRKRYRRSIKIKRRHHRF